MHDAFRLNGPLYKLPVQLENCDQAALYMASSSLGNRPKPGDAMQGSGSLWISCDSFAERTVGSLSDVVEDRKRVQKNYKTNPVFDSPQRALVVRLSSPVFPQKTAGFCYFHGRNGQFHKLEAGGIESLSRFAHPCETRSYDRQARNSWELFRDEIHRVLSDTVVTVYGILSTMYSAHCSSGNHTNALPIITTALQVVYTTLNLTNRSK